MGYAPADDPQIAIYVVVDRPNTQYQDDAKFATRIVKKILTEVLPYLNIFMTEELSDKEREELEELKLQIRMADGGSEEEIQTDEEGNPIDPENPEGTEEGADEPEESKASDVWMSFPKDPESGYLKDPNTGFLYDPDTGAQVSGDSLLGGEGEDTQQGAEPEGGAAPDEEDQPEPE